MHQSTAHTLSLEFLVSVFVFKVNSYDLQKNNLGGVRFWISPRTAILVLPKNELKIKMFPQFTNSIIIK